jgi:plastocyanin
VNSQNSAARLTIVSIPPRSRFGTEAFVTLPQRLSLVCFAGYCTLSIAAAHFNLLPQNASTCQTSATCAGSQDITGKILIKKKLTKRSVTASVSIYQRGTAVELGKDAEADPLAFERSHVVIYLEGPARTGPSTTLTMQQVNRRFSPDLVVIPVGSTVSFPNMDPIFHNIFSLSKPKTFDLGSYNKGESRSVVFSKPGVVSVYCHLHPNMAATVVVTPTRWYAQSDRSGQFRIQDVPSGQYTIVAWHKAAGFFRKSILVEPGHNSVADFFIPIGDDQPEKVPESGSSMSMVGDR